MQKQKFNLAPMVRCPLCGAGVPPEFANCRALFGAVCAREYQDRAFGAVHLMTVDAYALQHSEECGLRSNAFHLVRLGQMLESGAGAELGHRPRRAVGKALEQRYRQFPFLEPPETRGEITVADVYALTDPKEYSESVNRWARAVWDACQAHHDWARRNRAD